MEILPIAELLRIVTRPAAEPADTGLNSTCRVIDCVGLRLIGNCGASKVNPVPLLPAESMTIGDVPVEVRTRVFVTTVFTATLPKLRLAALMASCGLGVGVPAPLKETTVGLPADELLLMSNCSRDLPVDVGLNCTCSVNDCVGANVTGKAPTTAKLVPVSVVELTVTGAVPVEVNVSDCAVEVFTVTLPKLRLPVLTVSWGLGAAILTPLRATSVVLPVDESLLIVNVPVALPTVVGLN